MNPSCPALSVIVAAQGCAEETGRCLQTLREQQGLPLGKVEVVVAEGPPFHAQHLVCTSFPEVQYVPCHHRASLPVLHGAGLSKASGKLIALTEGHCTFSPDWAETALASREIKAAAVGGSVHPAASLNLLNLGLFFIDYAQFLPPMKPGATHDLPGNNVVFKRAALGEVDRFAGDGFWKTFFCRSLESCGNQLWSEPSMRIYYNRRLSLKQIVIRRYNHGRCFGAMRAEEIGVAKRVLYMAAGPIVPLLLVCKLLKRAWSKVDHRGPFILAVPSALLCAIIWSLGEWMGNVFGAGRSCDLL